MSTYFKPETIIQRMVEIKGLTGDEFYTAGGLRLNIEQALFLELKRNGYQRIVFYDQNNKLYTYDQASMDRMTGAVTTGAASPQSPPGGLRKGGWSQKGKKTSPDETAPPRTEAPNTDPAQSEPGEFTGIRLHPQGEGTLHMGMRDNDFVQRQVISWMNDSETRTAIVINDAQAFKQEFRTVPYHEFTVEMEHLGAENRNIMIWLYADRQFPNPYKEVSNDRRQTGQEQKSDIIIPPPTVRELERVLIYFYYKKGLKIRLQDIKPVARALKQAMNADCNEMIRIKSLYQHLENYGTDRPLTPDDCFTLLNRKKPKPASQQLDEMIGLQAVKDTMNLFKNLGQEEKRSEGSRLQPMEKGVKEGEMLHFLLTGNPGTGKTTVAKLLGQYFFEMGYLESGQVVEVSRKDLVGEYVGHTAIKTSQAVNRALGGVLFVDEAYALSQGGENDFGQEAIDTLVKLMDQLKGQFIAVYAGYPDDMEKFMETNEGLKRRIPYTINLADYTAEEMQQILLFRLKRKGATLSPDFMEALPDFCFNWVSALKKKLKKKWGNGGAAETLVDAMGHRWDNDPNHTLGTDQQGNRVKVLERHHVPQEYMRCFAPVKKDTPRTATEELEQMIGMKKVKEEIRKIQRRIIMTRNNPDLPNRINLNYVLTGNPGTGKTTVARIIGRVLYEYGILPFDTFKEVKRADLVAGYVGQTAPKTQKVIDRAMGGVLFIDEAYALSQGGENDFGKEAIETLLAEMENRKGDFAVIVAGYPDRMSGFIKSNPGLESRFKKVIHIPDYSADELAQIFGLKCRARGFQVDRELQERIPTLFANMIKSRSRDFGNGREVENLEEGLFDNWCVQEDEGAELIYTLDHLPDEYDRYLSGSKDTSPASGSTGTPSLAVKRERMAGPIPDFDAQTHRPLQKRALVLISTEFSDGEGTGSGSLFTEDGYILTCNHVVQDGLRHRVRLTLEQDGQEKVEWKQAIPVWQDKDLDAAILKIEGQGYPALYWRPSSQDTQEAEEIYHYGFPFGSTLSDNIDSLRPSYFAGRISSIQTKNGKQRINTDMSAKRGCSGGPVFAQKDGALIGILCGSQTKGNKRLMEEINYVLPIRYLWDVIDQHSPAQVTGDMAAQQLLAQIREQLQDNNGGSV